VRADDRLAAQVARALLHPHRQDDASVRVEGVPADALTDEDYRSQVVVAPHHDTLFTGTIAQNLTAVGAPRTAWDDALRAAGCTDVLDGLGGIDAPIGEMGARLSGGQRQRVALARALAVDAPVLVLHDPTTAVDAVTEATIATGLRSARRGRSTLLVTASPALLAVCDRVVDLGGSDTP
jgi:ABC-type multidrug transport system fused ATPase/permease subunit